MYKIRFAKLFRKSLKRTLRARNTTLQQVETLIDYLATSKIIDPKFHDHPLSGELVGYRECHLKPDLIVIYRKEENRKILLMADIGSHADLFGK